VVELTPRPNRHPALPADVRCAADWCAHVCALPEPPPPAPGAGGAAAAAAATGRGTDADPFTDDFPPSGHDFPVYLGGGSGGSGGSGGDGYAHDGHSAVLVDQWLDDDDWATGDDAPAPAPVVQVPSPTSYPASYLSSPCLPRI